MLVANVVHTNGPEIGMETFESLRELRDFIQDYYQDEKEINAEILVDDDGDLQIVLLDKHGAKIKRE